MKPDTGQSVPTTDANCDLISPEPGAHAASTGPGRNFNPGMHDVYWREAHTREPYYRSGYNYDDYAPCYRTGYEAAARNMDKTRKFDDLEPELRAKYERVKGKSRMAWADARHAARAAWDRVAMQVS